jgi:hypothetical protein
MTLHWTMAVFQALRTHTWWPPRSAIRIWATPAPWQRRQQCSRNRWRPNHGVADGNKRTTVILIHLLLTKSGYELVPVTGDADIGAALEQLVLSIVEHRRKLPDVVDWFKARIRKRKLPVPTASS